MGRKKNNPDLVQELIDGKWTMDQDEFEQKFNSLSTGDMIEVSSAVNNMENEIFADDAENETISVYEAAQIWLSSGKDEDYMFGYTEEELKKALR